MSNNDFDFLNDAIEKLAVDFMIIRLKINQLFILLLLMKLMERISHLYFLKLTRPWKPDGTSHH